MLILETDVRKVTDDVMNMLHEDERELINAFYDAVVAKDIDKIDTLFKVVLVEVEAHFKSEEDMMEQGGYAGLAVHKSDHDAMRAKLEKFHKRWEVLKGPKEVRSFLEKDFKKWMISHVATRDKDASQHLGS
ncbi:hemerythrin family protein [Sulfurimonas sp. SAG-AH-194-I05]|nr:hemerythrin family protein [Sulfurimonas sp. SAG-AH-194-I05]MDF1874475.1 hemerythrin family protein [Sulfurimonas sp. SAG-AH-194-I05]